MGSLFSKKAKRDTTKPTGLIVHTEQKGTTQTTDKKSYTFKILAIGDCGVGKSSLLIRYAKGSFPEQIDSNDLLSKSVTVDNTTCNLKIWDTAGQERFNTITSSFYRGAHIILIVFDLTSKQTFDNLHQWISEVDRYAAENAHRLIVGTKADLESERMVNANDANQFCQNKGLTYVETSAKTGDHVDYVFTTACHEILEAINQGRTEFEENEQ